MNGGTTILGYKISKTHKTRCTIEIALAINIFPSLVFIFIGSIR